MNIWEIHFYAGLALLIGIPLLGFARGLIRRAKANVHYRYYLFAGILLSSVALIAPIQWQEYMKDPEQILHSAVTSVNYVLQMFSLNAGYDPVKSFAGQYSANLTPCMARAYPVPPAS